jgi:hypothetical protein
MTITGLHRRVSTLEGAAGTGAKPVLVALCLDLAGPDLAFLRDPGVPELRREECDGRALLAGGAAPYKLMSGVSLDDI